MYVHIKAIANTGNYMFRNQPKKGAGGKIKRRERREDGDNNKICSCSRILLLEREGGN